MDAGDADAASVAEPLRFGACRGGGRLFGPSASTFSFPRGSARRVRGVDRVVQMEVSCEAEDAAAVSITAAGDIKVGAVGAASSGWSFPPSSFLSLSARNLE